MSCTKKERTASDGEKSPPFAAGRSNNTEAASEDNLHSEISNKRTAEGTGLPTKRKRRKPKFKRPFGYPTQPLTAYNYFFKEERVNFLREFQEGSEEYLNMGTVIAGRWKELPPKKRKKFEALSAEDKERFQKELDTYNAHLMGTSANVNTSSAHETAPNTTAVDTERNYSDPNGSGGGYTVVSRSSGGSSSSQSGGTSCPPSRETLLEGFEQLLQQHIETRRNAATLQRPRPADLSILPKPLRDLVQFHQQQQDAQQPAIPEEIDNQAIRLILALHQTSPFLSEETASLLRQLELVQDLIAQIRNR